MRRVIRAVWLLGLAAWMGCSGVSGPQLRNPGTADVQRRRIQRFDPLPDPNIGPEVVGARPREMSKPVPEPERARWPVPGVR